eukprot:c7354_g3_i1.p1 GENE.c7354_g3_i1~~c7354_g3_i1.p1  ORF type:complete len:618 (-),score=145.97 c7354_g3_i1:266-2119(-)
MKVIMPSKLDATAPPFTNLWLLWLGAGLNAVLSSFGFPVTLSLLAMVTCWVIWLALTVEQEILFCSFLFGIADIFFREVEVCGGDRVPKQGPVIFACAPHANQLFDPIVVMKVVDNCAQRRVSFLAAAKTVRRRFVGILARGVGCIPVERPQDLAHVGPGTVVAHHTDQSILIGSDTNFTHDIAVGDQIKIISLSQTVKITQIESSTQLHIEPSLRAPLSNPSSYQILPYIDQSGTFDQVYDKLAMGSTIGIFPEGGSHDRTQLLPLKAGVSVMALGAMVKYPGLNVQIVPIGLNYDSGHHFRSKVLVDIGHPIQVTPELIREYQQGGENRKKAGTALLEKVLLALRSVVVETRDYQTLRMLQLMRRMIQHPDHTPTPEERFVVTQELAIGYERSKEDVRVKQLMVLLEHYDKTLKAYGLKDHQVATSKNKTHLRDKQETISLLVSRLMLVVAYSLFVLPGLFLSFPVMATAYIISSKKAHEAVRESSVKVAGRDVVATWKVLIGMVMVPIVHILYSCIAFSFGGESLAVVYFFFAPFVCALGIKCTENGLRVWRSVGVLLLALFDRDAGHRLSDERERLSSHVIELVQSLKWLTKVDGGNWAVIARRHSSQAIDDM